jgi:ATP-binding cassette subfamily F protein 3
LSKEQRKRFKQVETRIATLQAELKQIETQLADPAIYGNDGGIEIGQLGQRQETLTREHAALETEWLALYERLETA